MTLEDRVARLERENRCWRGAALLGVAMVLGLFAMGQTGRPPRELRADAFVLTSGGGDVVASLDSSLNGLPSLSMYIPGAQLPAITLRVAKSEVRSPDGGFREAVGPELEMLGPNGAVTLELEPRDASPALSMRQASGLQRIKLGLSGGDPYMNLWAQDGSVLWSAP